MSDNEIKSPLSMFMVVLFAGIILTIINAFVFMLLWDLVMPEIFGLKPLGFMNSVCILVLFDILRGSRDVQSKSD